jgi:wyosine [tRNA(Phe)-imidazoG37] synthetase (radical SAM superfamily)
MDYGILITAILGSAGLFSFIQFVINRHDKKNEAIKEFRNEIKIIKDTQRQTILRVTRMELLNIIEKEPNNIDAILQVAEYYFIELSGNAYAHAIFEKWAKQHNVSIDWLPSLQKGKQ